MRLNTSVKSTNVSQFRTKHLSSSRIGYAQKEYDKEIDYTQAIDSDELIVPPTRNVNNQNSTITTTAPVDSNVVTNESQTTVVASLESDNYSGVETHTVAKSDWDLADLREYYNSINIDNNTDDSSIKLKNTLGLDFAESTLESVLEKLTAEQKKYYFAYKNNIVDWRDIDDYEHSVEVTIAEKYQEIMPIISLEEDIENLRYEQQKSYYIELVDSKEFKEFYNRESAKQALDLFIYQNCFNLDEILNSSDYMNGIIFIAKDGTEYQYDDFVSLREKLSQLNQTNLQVYFYLLENDSLERANQYLNSVNSNTNYEKKQPVNYIAKYSKEFEEFINTFHSSGLNINKEDIDYFKTTFEEIDTLYIYSEPVDLDYDFLNQIYEALSINIQFENGNTSAKYIDNIIKNQYPEYYKNYTETNAMKNTLDYVIDNYRNAIINQYPYKKLEQSNDYIKFYDTIKKNSESEMSVVYNIFSSWIDHSSYDGNEIYAFNLLNQYIPSNSKLGDALPSTGILTEEEKKTVFYLAINKGQDAAYDYFLSIHNEVNSRAGYKEAMDWMEEYYLKETSNEKALLIASSGIGDGICNYFESLSMLFSKNEVPTILEYKEMYIFNELMKDSDFRAYLYEFSQQTGEAGTQIGLDLMLLKLGSVSKAATLVKAFDGIISGAANAGQAKHNLEMDGVGDAEVGIYTLSTLVSSEVFTRISKRTFTSLVTPNATRGIRGILNNRFILTQLTAMTASYANSNFKTIFKSCIMNHKIDLKTIVSSFGTNAPTALVDGLVYASFDYIAKNPNVKTKFPIEIEGIEYEIDIAILIKNLSKRVPALNPSSFGNIESTYSEFKALYEACPELINANPSHIFDDYLEKMNDSSDGEELYEEVESEVEEIVEEQLKGEDKP